MSSCFNCKSIFTIAKKTHLTKLIVDQYAFAPPKEVNYEIVYNKEDEEQKVGPCYRKVNFKHKLYDNIIFPWIELDCYSILKSNKKNRIVVLRIINKFVEKNEKNTVIFSHGNSCDLGTQYSFLMDLSTQLKCDVICYDYSGYGKSGGNYSEKEIQNDIEEVLKMANDHLHIPSNKIIIMGYSLGSVPSVHISSMTNLKCLVLIAPLASGIKTLIKNFNIPTHELEKIDVFCNLSKITDIACPIFLIHGKSDEIIDVNHSYEILKKVKNPNTWFPSKGTHCNIFTSYRRKFYEKINIFLDKVKIFHSENVNEDDIYNIETDSVNKNYEVNNYKNKNIFFDSDKVINRFINMSIKRNRQENDLTIEQNHKITFCNDLNEEDLESEYITNLQKRYFLKTFFGHEKDSNQQKYNLNNGVNNPVCYKKYDEEIINKESIIKFRENLVNEFKNPFGNIEDIQIDDFQNDTNFFFENYEDRLSNTDNYDFKNIKGYCSNGFHNEKNGFY